MEQEKMTILKRTYIIYVMTFLFGFAVIGKIAYIQFGEGSDLRQKADSLNYKFVDIEAMRGNIYSADGKLMAVSLPVFDIYFDVSKTNIKDDAIFNAGVDSLSYYLWRLLGDHSKNEYKAKLIHARENNRQYMLIKRRVSYDELNKLRTLPLLKRSLKGSALIAEQVSQRELPFKNLARRTIGWNKETAEKNTGLETAYNDILSGVKGKQMVQRMVQGEWRPLDDEFKIEPRNGKDIISSIDVIIQDVAHNALLKQLIANEAEQGCVILMEVKTGYVSAIVNLQKSPSGEYEERYNYAVGHSCEPGSTFKLASLLAAFEDNKLSLQDSVDTGNGIHYFGRRKIEDSHRGGYGKISVGRAFEVSSNVGVAKIMHKYYHDKQQALHERFLAMSLGAPLGIELPGEGTPVLRKVHNQTWANYSLPSFAMGYEVNLTPLQVLTFYNAVANNGVMVRPLFVKEIREAGSVVKKFDPFVINASIASPRSIEMAKTMLRGVVENGTAQNLKQASYKIAGKTGTARMHIPGHGYSSKEYNATFAGYFPADNPKYSMIVVISKPSKGIFYGSQLAAPVFLEVANKVYASSLDIQPAISQQPDTTTLVRNISGYRKDMLTTFRELNLKIFNHGNSDWAAITFDSDVVKVDNHDIEPDKIPNVIGMSARDASYLLERFGLRVSLVGSGTVTSQNPEAGTELGLSNEIVLHLTI